MSEYTSANGARIINEFVYGGVEIAWENVAEKDRDAFRQTISDYATTLKALYDVETDLSGADLGLKLWHKSGERSTPIERQILKGIVFVIVSDTIWGGGPG